MTRKNYPCEQPPSWRKASKENVKQGTKCDTCKTPFVRDQLICVIETQVSYMRGDDEVDFYCESCASKREVLTPTEIKQQSATEEIALIKQNMAKPGGNTPGRQKRLLELEPLVQNVMTKAVVENWCINNGVLLTVTNENEHWAFRRPPDIVEWWPSTGKVVTNKQWNKSIRCYDCLQVIQQLEKVFPVLYMDKDCDAVCAYCEHPVVGQFVLFGDVLLHPVCHIQMNNELDKQWPVLPEWYHKELRQ